MDEHGEEDDDDDGGKVKRIRQNWGDEFLFIFPFFYIS